MSTEAFTDAMSSFPSGVTIVTSVDAHGTRNGLTLSAFSSISSEPPLIMVSLMDTSNTLAQIQGSGEFAVNFLAEDAEFLAKKFASKAEDKFQNFPTSYRNVGGPIFYDHVCAYVTCKVVQEIPVADHVLIIGSVEEAFTDNSRKPLLYGRRQFTALPTTDDSILS